jgi:hypothetical protein
VHGTLSPSKWVRLKFSAIKGIHTGRVRWALTGENNSGFSEPLATGKHPASKRTSLFRKRTACTSAIRAARSSADCNESRITIMTKWVLASSRRGGRYC